MKRLTALLALAAFSLAAAVPEPLLKADFEGDTGSGKLKGKAQYVQGVQGKAVRLADAQITFPMLEKLSPAEGTATIWVKPVNWSWKKKEFVFFLTTKGILLYKYHLPLGLLANYGLSGKFGVGRTYANMDWSKFPENTWMALGMTWSKKKHLLALYANGKKLASSKLVDTMVPPALETWVVNAVPFHPRDRKNTTDFDTLRIYDRALSEDEMMELYQTETPKSIQFDLGQLRKTRFHLPELRSAPKIDGEFDEREWSDAAKLGGFLSSKGLDIAFTGDVYAGFHGNKLYLCYIFQLPGATKLTAECTKRDSAVYGDDAAEVILHPDNMGPGEFYQGIFNSRNTIFDQKNGKKDWNGAWEVKSGMYEGYLNIEVAIPLSELGSVFKDGMEWGFNFARDRIASREIIFSCVSPYPGSRLFTDPGTMKFVSKGLSGRLMLDYHKLFNRSLDAVFRVSNRSSAEKEVELLVELATPDLAVLESKKLTAKIPANGAFDFKYANPLAGIRGAVLRLTATEKGAEKPFHIQDIPLAFKDEFRLSDKTDLKKNQVSVEVDCSSHRLTVDAAEVTGTLGGRQVKFTGRPLAKGTFDLTGLKPGDYPIELVFRDKSGKELLRYRHPYTHIGQPDWLTTHYGENAGVLWPYTPIKFENNVFEVWGRTHKFGRGLLPESVVSQGRALFAAPPELRLTADGKKYVVSNFKFKTRSVKPELVVLDFTAEAGKVKFEGSVSMEFDGFIWYDVKMTGSSNITIDDLRLVIPLAPGIAEFYNAHYFGREKEAGKMKLPLVLKRFPTVWAGNLDVGFTFMLESYKSWRHKDVNSVFEFAGTGKGVEWTVKMIDRPVKLDRVYNYGFAVEANPAKPNPPWFRSWRLGSMRPHNIMHPWGFDRVNTKKYSGAGGFYTPVFKSIEVFRGLLKQYKDKGVDFSVYLNPFLCSPESTEWKVFNKEWNNPYNCYPECPNSSFTDYIMGCIDLLMKNGLKVIYVDSLGAVNCANPLHGCGYTDEETGETVLTWPVRGMRNYMKRLYAMLHPYDGRNQREYFMWAHTSARNSVALNAFLDCFNCGEELENKVVTEPNYVRLYPLDEYQVFYLDTLAGVPMAGANLGRIGPKKDRYHKPYNDQFVMLVLLHDSQIWNGWLDEPYVSTFYHKLDKWGYKDESLKFHSYRRQKLIVSPDADIHVSVYTLPDRALAVIGNWQNTPRKVSVKIDKKALGLGDDLTFTDLRSGKAVDPAAIELPGYNFILMDIRKK